MGSLADFVANQISNARLEEPNRGKQRCHTFLRRGFGRDHAERRPGRAALLGNPRPLHSNSYETPRHSGREIFHAHLQTARQDFHGRTTVFDVTYRNRVPA